MKKLAMAVLLVATFASGAKASTVTASDLLTLLEAQKTSYAFGVGAGFVSGAFLSTYAVQEVTKGQATDWPKTCIPGGTTAKEFRLGWKHWAKTSGNMKPKQHAVVSLVTWARKAYPCDSY